MLDDVVLVHVSHLKMKIKKIAVADQVTHNHTAHTGSLHMRSSSIPDATFKTKTIKKRKKLSDKGIFFFLLIIFFFSSDSKPPASLV